MSIRPLEPPSDNEYNRPERADDQLADTDAGGLPFDGRPKDAPDCLGPLEQVGKEDKSGENG